MIVGAAAPGIVVRGHGAASGRGSDRYPEGTLAAQIPIFTRLGLDLSDMYRGTLNVDVTPLRFEPGRADHTFVDVSWTDAIPPETFSFFRCRVGTGTVAHLAWIYRPHPETKVEHRQDPTVVECLAPFIEGVAVGDAVVVELGHGRGRFA